MKKILFFCFSICLFTGEKSFSQITLTDQKIEILLKEVARIEGKMDAINAKLSFDEMAVMTLVTSDLNMIKEAREGFSFYHHEIKIDNPVCNNNSKAIVLVANHAIGNEVEAVNIFYNESDKFWYIKTPDWKYKGFEPGIIIDPQPTIIKGISASSKPGFREVKYTDFRQVYGIGYAGPKWPGIEEKFSVVIFTELPVPMTKFVPEDDLKTAKPRTDKPYIDTPRTANPRTDIPLLVTPNTVDTSTKKMTMPMISVSGEWKYKMVSASGSTLTGKVFLVVNETSVSGNLFTNDKTKTAISGTLINSELLLSRVTGLQTTQIYNLRRGDKNHISGTYRNEGKYTDSGMIEFFR